jgi:hypothetical protein
VCAEKERKRKEREEGWPESRRGRGWCGDVWFGRREHGKGSDVG